MELNKPISGEERKKRYMDEKPSFFYDDSKKDEAEILLDFYLSFTLRCAVEHPNVNPLVREYSKRVLLFLIQKELKTEFHSKAIIKSVRTKKQIERIDLIAEIELELDYEKKYYALIFENKLYTKSHSNQINKYKSIAENYYNNHSEKSKYKRIYLYATCLEDVPEEDIQACNEADFRYLTFQEIRDSLGSDARTGDTLFDEFWFRYY